ncbi:MAG: class I SAM-dependent RNA methyltransferase [Deltaproteobacteria bacterium]|nr:class I SAM-dependent RNA methyltransferase [Deltaproteobacteria bacterium]
MTLRDRRTAREPRELLVDDVAMTGEGVAHLPNGDAVFVPSTIAGERILADIGGGRPRRGALLELLAAAPTRVEPPCPDVARCGGCDFMHLSSEGQAAWHRDHAARAVQGALGKLGVSAPELGYHPAPKALGYRTRARLHVAANGRHVKVGYRGARSHELVSVATCAVLDDALSPLLAELPGMLQGSRGDGEAILALGCARRPVFDLRFAGTLSDAALRAFEQAVDGQRLAGCRVLLERAKEPLVFGDPRPFVRAADGLDLVVAPGGFAQASDDAAMALARHVAARAASSAGGKAVELFAGCGTLTVALAPVVGALVAVEQDEPSVKALRENVERRGLNVKVRHEDANTLALPKADLVVLDPPRGGAPGASARIVEMRPKRVVYVSCNALTLARDLATLVGARYRVEALDLFDVFPQTSHVEVVASLVK